MTHCFLRHIITTVFIVIAAIDLTSCASSPQKTSTRPISTTSDREKLAVDLQGRGELAEALIEWKILSSIEPDNNFYKNRIDAITQFIDVKTKSLMREGVGNLRRGESESARLSFLKTLALDPKNREAFEYLQQLARASSRAEKNSGKAAGNQCCRSGKSLPEYRTNE
jgi:tetratricopeptide (TPR) repeat protein